MTKHNDEFFTVNVTQEIARLTAKIKAAESVQSEEEGIVPPKLEELLDQGLTLAEALAIIAQWYIDHPGYE